MSATWFQAVASQPALASQLNQFLTGHPCAFYYDGTSIVSNAAGSGTVNTLTWLAEKFVMSGTAIGRIEIPLAVSSTPGVLLVSLYTNGSSAPGTLIVSAAVPYQAASGVVSIPLAATGLTSGGTYWIVVKLTGSGSTYWTWAKGTAGTGGSTSTNGTSWTAQSYSFQYTVYDQTASGNLRHIVSDGDPTSRWWGFDYTSGNPTVVRDSVASGGVGSAMALSYSSGNLSSVAAL